MAEDVDCERRSDDPGIKGSLIAEAAPAMSAVVHHVIGQPLELVIYRDRDVAARVPLARRQAERLAWELLGGALGRPA